MPIRTVKVEKNYLKHAEGSCLFSMGETRVLCVASVENKVPFFIEKEGLNKGWVTAEYSLLPRAGKERTPRNRSTGGGRSQEISRLIGRSLRGIIDLKVLGTRSIILDCDVIKADGGTRTASINGAFISLVLALKKLQKEKAIDSFPIKEYLGAVSVGIVKGKKILDLCAEEDNNADVDMNVVMTGSGRIVEIQGTAEKETFSKKDLDEMLVLAWKGIKSIINIQKKIIGQLK
ncbi:MAG: ribonuclease PH [Elusimicrobia bacterium]|nr:ribonuclease PH [Elusimicrobiota bacterium]